MGLAQKTFGEIITFTRHSAATRINHLSQLETVAANMPRIDYDPVTQVSRGLLIEGQRTNLFTNSDYVGGVSSVDNGGAASGGVITYNIAGTPIKSNYTFGTDARGRKFVDVRIYGTNTNSNPVYIAMGPVNAERPATSITAGQVVTAKITVQLIAGSFNGFLHFGNFTMFGNGGAQNVSFPGNPQTVITSQETTWSVTANIATSGGLRPPLFSNPTINPGNTVDVTLRFCNAQIEVGPGPTTYIPTSGAQATRAADALIVPLGPWFRAQEGSFYARFFAPPNTGERVVFDLSNGSAAERLKLTVIDGTLRLLVTAGGIEQANISLGAVTPGANVRCALRYAANDIAAVVNNGTVQTDTSAVLPVATTLRLGHDPIGNHLNSVLADFDYFPRAMTNAQLQALTA